MKTDFVMIGGQAYSPKHPKALALQSSSVSPPVAIPQEHGSPVAKRLRQSSKPKMNKLETEWHEYLKQLLGDSHIPIHAQDKTYVLANGLRYTPDFTAIIDRTEHAWEVKGKWVDGDSFPKLKMFASKWPEIRVILAWKDSEGQWQTQTILP